MPTFVITFYLEAASRKDTSHLSFTSDGVEHRRLSRRDPVAGHRDGASIFPALCVLRAPLR